MSVVGRWRIVETELWDSGALDLVAPAFIEFGGTGWALRLYRRAGGAGLPGGDPGRSAGGGVLLGGPR
jgi:hypothetical protein